MAVKKPNTSQPKTKKGQKVSFAKESPIIDKDAEAHTQGSSAEKSVVVSKPKATAAAATKTKKSISPKETKNVEKKS